MKNALVFDDNKILSELIQMKVEALFKKYGLEFQVDRMNSLAQLEACDKTYQLAFMDIVLPEQDGIVLRESGRIPAVSMKSCLYLHTMTRCLHHLIRIRYILSVKRIWMRIWSRRLFPIKERFPLRR